jgi:hypothetical protein
MKLLYCSGKITSKQVEVAIESANQSMTSVMDSLLEWGNDKTKLNYCNIKSCVRK